jgi:hypothetical protein
LGADREPGTTVTRVLLATAAALITFATGQEIASAANRPAIARPNPGFVSIQLDYVNALHSASGGIATLPALDPAVIDQAVADQQYLSYLHRDDLGGFLPAPIGQHALSSGGHEVVGQTGGRSQIPKFDQAASGKVQAFAFTGEPPATPPDQGQQPVPGVGIPPPVPAPTNSNTTPLPNQGFGGRPPTTTTTVSTTTEATTTNSTTTEPTTTRTTPTTPTTTTTRTTTTTTTTATTTTPTTTTTGRGSPPPPSGNSCGTIGLSIDSNLAGCRIYAVNMAPGDSAFERMTIRNEADVSLVLSLRASGTTNRLWDDLEMGVWEVGTPVPSPLPALLWWTAQDNQLTTLQPGQTVTYQVEIALPATAGNADQGYGATIDFHWYAQG